MKLCNYAIMLKGCYAIMRLCRYAINQIKIHCFANCTTLRVISAQHSIQLWLVAREIRLAVRGLRFAAIL